MGPYYRVIGSTLDLWMWALTLESHGNLQVLVAGLVTPLAVSPTGLTLVTRLPGPSGCYRPKWLGGSASGTG